MNEQLNIILVASECRNFAKVGGLGDVVYDLSKALAAIKLNVSVIIPYYGVVKNCRCKKIFSCSVSFGKKKWPVDLFQYIEDHTFFYFIYNDYFFGGDYSDIYIDSFKNGRGPFEDDAKRFAFFSAAVMEIIKQFDAFKNINMIHCHDWHTGILLLKLNYDARYFQIKKKVKTVFSIHNLDYQGVRPYLVDYSHQLASFKDWFPRLYYKLLIKNHLLQYSNLLDIEKISANEIEENLLFTESKYHKMLDYFLSCYEKDQEQNYYYLKEKLTPLQEKKLCANFLKSSFMGFNAMRACIKLADLVNTVSPTYAYEITQPDDEAREMIRGRGLERDLDQLYQNNKLIGILNGLNYQIYDPQKLKFPYDHDHPDWPALKRKNKEDFLYHLKQTIQEVYQRSGTKFINYEKVSAKLEQYNPEDWLDKPLVVSIGRAAYQKVGLLLERGQDKNQLIEELLKRELFLIVTASGEMQEELEIINEFKNGLYICAFDQTLGIDLYSSGDLFLMPSYFEPCGISQMIALRYGTLPLVNDIGGLHDTVKEFENGFLFRQEQNKTVKLSLLHELDRAIDCFIRKKETWQTIQGNAMLNRFHWSTSAQKYQSIYQKLLAEESGD